MQVGKSVKDGDVVYCLDRTGIFTKIIQLYQSVHNLSLCGTRDNEIDSSSQIGDHHSKQTKGKFDLSPEFKPHASNAT